MQKLALHMEHYKKAQVVAIGAEGQREIEHTRDGRVDFSLSKGNFQASTGEPMDKKNYFDAIQSQLNDFGITEIRKGRKKVYVYPDGKAVRSDANILTGIVVTLDRETVEAWGEKNTRNYFKSVSLFLEKKFGNKIDDIVHVDELGAGYHMHFYGISVKKDASGIIRLNTKDVWKRSNLRQLHTDLAKFLQEKNYPIERGHECSGVAYERSFRDIKKRAQAIKEDVSRLEDNVLQLQMRANHKKGSKGFLGFGAAEDHIEIALDDYDRLLQLVQEGCAALMELEENRKHIDQSQRLAKAIEDKLKLEQELNKLKEELELYKTTRDKDLQQAVKSGERHILAVYKDEINNGKAIKPVLAYSDLLNQVNFLIKEGRKRDREHMQKSNQNRIDDDYSR